MAKKKSIENEFVEVSGTPTPLLLPSRNYKFKVYEEQYSLRVPRRGKYVDLNDKLFSEKDGEFNILSHDDDENMDIVFLPAISKLLFATAQYPDMKDNQAFVPIALIIKDDYVDIIGNLIEMMEV